VRILLPVFVVLIVFLFVFAFAAPRRSERLQSWIDDRMEKGEGKGERKAGRLGRWAAVALDWCQRAADGALRGGRKLRGKTSN